MQVQQYGWIVAYLHTLYSPYCKHTHSSSSTVTTRVCCDAEPILQWCSWISKNLSCVPNWRVDAVRLRFMRAQTRAQAFTKKTAIRVVFSACDTFEYYFFTLPVKVTGMYAGTCLIRAENSNMLEFPFQRVSVRMAPQKPAEIRTNAWFHSYMRQL